MNICFFTHRSPVPTIGGVERVTYNLISHFRQMGLGVYNLTCFGDNPASVIPQDRPVAERILFVNRFLEDNDIDVLIDQYGNMPMLEHPHIPRSVKIIYCFHTDPEGKHLIRSLLEVFNFKDLRYSLFNLACVLNTPRRRFRYKQNIRRKIDRGVDRIVYLSENYIPYVSWSLGGAPEEKFSAIPNAVEPRLLTTPPHNGLHNKTKTIMWCGRMVHNPKNVLFIPRLWSRLSRLHPDWELVLVGDGIDRRLVETRIKRYNLTNIRLVGFANPYEYYRKSSIFICPSYSEGFGMVLIEAMSQGCVPVVFNSSRVFPDIINSGKDGYIVPDMDEQAYAEACDRLMTDLTLRETMSTKAIESVKKFSIDNISKQWLALFDSLLKSLPTSQFPNPQSVIPGL